MCPLDPALPADMSQVVDWLTDTMKARRLTDTKAACLLPSDLLNWLCVRRAAPTAQAACVQLALALTAATTHNCPEHGSPEQLSAAPLPAHAAPLVDTSQHAP